jgi:hydroxymethylpyrimidine pyrophosphatase-like HAD family hydrolase
MNDLDKPVIETEPQEVINPYNSSDITDKLTTRCQNGDPLRIAFLDIDSTLTSTPEEQVAVRDKLEKLGFTIIFVTSRTEEMMLPSTSYADSPEVNSRRKPPKLKKSGTSITIDQMREGATTFELGFPDEVRDFDGLHTADVIIAQTGGVTLINRDGVYAYDNRNSALDTGWVDRVKSQVEEVQQLSEINCTFSKVDQPNNYEQGRIDVDRTDRRVQINFDTIEDQQKFTETYNAFNEDDKVFDMVEDGDQREGKKRYQVYLMPRGVNKKTAVDNAIHQIIEAVSDRVERKLGEADLELLYAGDSAPDVAMALRPTEASSTFIVVAGSRLVTDGKLVDRVHSQSLTEEMEGFQEKDGNIGVLEDSQGRRRIIIGETFGDPTIQQRSNTGSILAYLETIE